MCFVGLNSTTLCFDGILKDLSIWRKAKHEPMDQTHLESSLIRKVYTKFL